MKLEESLDSLKTSLVLLKSKVLILAQKLSQLSNQLKPTDQPPFFDTETFDANKIKRHVDELSHDRIINSNDTRSDDSWEEEIPKQTEKEKTDSAYKTLGLQPDTLTSRQKLDQAYKKTASQKRDSFKPLKAYLHLLSIPESET